ncbi:eCIS core domain-containing protein [Rhizobium leguminosarum]|uniref:eCIS core domain-containing protein n=1 Tax=Rhizobium leguminosarum TaxID=384 RepID=UPI0011823861|nr:DUF4157 domain-containing protein [Rhizobium leguminosarum]
MKTQVKIAKKPAGGDKAKPRWGSSPPVVRRDLRGNTQIGAAPKKADLPDKIPAFTEGIETFSADELNEAAMTVLGELTAHKHSEWKEEAHAIASEIFNRSRAIAEAQADFVTASQNLAEAKVVEAAAVRIMEEKNKAFKAAKDAERQRSAQVDFDAARTSSNAARRARGVAEAALNKASDKRISVGHFIKAKKGVEKATLAQIVEPHDQFEGHTTGTSYRNKFDQSDPETKTENMLERWAISKAAVEQLAKDPSVAAPYLYNLSEPSFKKLGRPMRKSEKKIGGNIFSTQDIRGKEPSKKDKKQPIQRSVMPLLEVGRIDDPVEREAEAVTDRVMRMRDGSACCSACASGAQCANHAPQIEHGLAMPLRRTVPGVGNSAGLPVPAGLEPQVRRATSGGEALPASVRAFFEPRFGEDLSHVRIHRDTDAAESARALGAKAYTLGSHIAFSAGRWAPGTDAGDRLIAHELAHVTANGEGPIRREVEPDDGTCLRGAMTPMAAGQAAHKQIQTAAKAFEIDTEAGIPKKATKGVPRADLFGVWTEPEARRRGLPTTRTPENDTPWVIAEIGEIKPVSYAQGGIRHAQARKEIADYLKYWEGFSKVPAIPMRSLRPIGPLEFMGSELFCGLDFPVDGLYIYRCSKLRDPKQELVPVRIPEETQDAVKRELRKFRDVEQLPTMKPEQLRRRLAADMPQLLSLLRQFVVTISVAAAIIVVVALLVLAFPLLVEASAVAAALLLAASSV